MSLGVSGVLALLCLVGMTGLLYPVVRAERHARFVAQWINVLASVTGASLGRMARLLLPLLIWISWILAGCVGVFLAESADGVAGGEAFVPRVVGLGVWLAAFLALGVLMLVVARSGRPRALVLRPCRGLSEQEAGAWVAGVVGREATRARRGNSR